MDLNKQIIFAVRKRPCLNNSRNINERNLAWKQLAEELKIDETLLKIRWNLLLKRYQADEFCKYGQFMRFVDRNELQQTFKWPEFEITEDDVGEWRCNKEENNFLEVEDLESSLEDAHKMKLIQRGAEKNDKLIQGCDESVACLKNPNGKEYAEIGEWQESREDKDWRNNPKDDNNKSENSSFERCEDVIFGELVSAMLKRMDGDKKRNIKKEIMNLLLT